MPRISTFLLAIILLFPFLPSEDQVLPRSTEIRVLIYDSEASSKTVELQRSLELCNGANLIPGYRFNVTRGWFDRADRLDAEVLAGFDVLIVPGGYPALLHQYWNREEVRSWIGEGGGYVGICAGEILAVEGSVKDPFFGRLEGLDITPNIVRTGTRWVGGRNIRMTADGARLLGLAGDQRVLNWNGSLLAYRERPSAGSKIFAYYYGNSSDVEIWDHGKDYWNPQWGGSAAVMGDYFGKGRVMLSGPHPEHPRGSGVYQKPRMIGGMVKWAFRDDSPIPLVLGREEILASGTSIKDLSAVSCRVPVDVRLSSLNLYVREGRGRAIFGVYGAGSHGEPGELLAQTEPLLLSGTQGWQKAELRQQLGLKADTTVWLAWIFEMPASVAAEYPRYESDMGESRLSRSNLDWNSLPETDLPSHFPPSGKSFPLFISFYGEASIRQIPIAR